ncbi:helix-turn-helix domain-containing protein [Streptomyces olivoreticuli]
MAIEFSTLLRQLRRNAGITQETLAERAGVGVRTIRGLETGERADPRVNTVRLLADALELRPAEREELLAAAVHRTEHRTDGSADHVEPAAGQPGSALHESLAEVAGQLAQVVAARWQREEEQRQVRDPYPLPVCWRPVAEELIDHWANIRRLPAGSTHGALDLSGRLDEVVGVYRRIPSGRLAVLGRAGSGKTILTVRFVLDRLQSRARAESVPVIFSIGSWDPTATTLRDWLAAQLTRDHPGLAAPGPGGSALAAALVESGWVLPVLDGFDEIAGGLRRPALEALNATTLPLLLTSRPAQYAAAVAETDVLTSAAAVELTDLTLDDLADYLPRSTRKAPGTDPAGTAWDPVLTALHEQPDNPACTNLTTVLTTPLMITLARTIYSDTPGHDPATLLDTQRFDSPEALEHHLLDTFIPTVYRDQSPAHRERVTHWLGYLAAHLERLSRRDLAWWQLGTTMSHLSQTLIVGLTIGLASGLVAGLLRLVDYVPAQALVEGLANGASLGMTFGLVHGLLPWLAARFKFGDAVLKPSRMEVRIRGGARRARANFVPRLMAGLGLGLTFGPVLGLTYGLTEVFWVKFFGGTVFIWPFFANWLMIESGAGLAIGVVYGVMAGLEVPIDIRSSVSPSDLLNTNRRTVLLRSSVAGVVFGLGYGITLGMMDNASSGPLNGTISGLEVGLEVALAYALGLTAWGRWAALARIALPLAGRLPWKVSAFLDDAHRRGVLRQAGAVYQFRHAKLQDHLAQNSQSTS